MAVCLESDGHGNCIIFACIGWHMLCLRRVLSCLTVVPIEICGGIDLAMDLLHVGLPWHTLLVQCFDTPCFSLPCSGRHLRLQRVLSCLTVVPIEICGGIDLAMDHLHMPMCIDAGSFTNSTPSRVGLKSSPTMLSSQLNGELAGRPRHQIEVWASEKFSRRLGGGMQLGREPCYRLRGQQLYDTTRCVVWQGVASAVGWMGTQHMGRGLVKPFPPTRRLEGSG